MNNLLVVVDMVNGFVKFGALHDKNINNITPTIIEAIKFAKQNGFDLVAFKDAHSVDDKEFETYPVHCLKGTAESDLIDELKPYQKHFDFVIDKNTTNGFVTKEFQELIKTKKYDNVFLTGCCTDICVLNFFDSYNNFAKQNGLDTKFVVLENACATFDAPNHSATEMHTKALSHMKNCGAKIATFPIKEDEETL